MGETFGGERVMERCIVPRPARVACREASIPQPAAGGKPTIESIRAIAPKSTPPEICHSERNEVKRHLHLRASAGENPS